MQQVFRERDAALREKDTENSFAAMPLEAKGGGLDAQNRWSGILVGYWYRLREQGFVNCHRLP